MKLKKLKYSLSVIQLEDISKIDLSIQPLFFSYYR